MTAAELLEQVEKAGGVLIVNGDRLRYRFPEEVEPLRPQLKTHRDEVYRLVSERQNAPSPPVGVRGLEWKLLMPPVVLTEYSVVNDVDKFARFTLAQLGHALAGRNWQAGNWSVRDLVERLEQCGVKVEVEVQKK